jgi:thiol-disulfide isomerase/thioredoxin
MRNIVSNQLIDYKGYTELVLNLVTEGKTTGSNQTEKLVEFTKLNQQRMNRLNKTIKLNDHDLSLLNRIEQPKYFLVIGEAWCGDCAQILPILNKIAEASNGKISMGIIFREVSPELIEEYGVNGTISIPKLLIYNLSTDELTGTWGSRPKPALEIVKKWKENKDTITHDQFEQELHLWYARDKGRSIIDEILKIVV